MTGEIEGLGELVTGGLAARAIEGANPAPDRTALPHCLNCGTARIGDFCHVCGQSGHIHRSLAAFWHDLLHGVLHFEGKTWRTLPMLFFRPGELTRRYVEGERARFISPLAMFLFTVFIMFFAFSFMGGGHEADTAPVDPVAAAQDDLEGARTALTALEAQTGVGRSQTAIDAVKASLPTIEARVAAAQKEAADRSPAAMAHSPYRADGLVSGSWQANVRDMVLNDNIDLGDGYMGKKIEKKLLNPDLALYKIQQTTYKFSFLLIPLSIPFVALLFLWKRGFTWYDHGVFVLYSLTAISILSLLIAVLGPLWSGFAFVGTMAVGLGIPIHMFAQLKGAYGLSWFSALWRTWFLLWFSVIALTLFLTIIIALGLTG